jgi:hypothetical protein
VLFNRLESLFNALLNKYNIIKKKNIKIQVENTVFEIWNSIQSNEKSHQCIISHCNAGICGQVCVSEVISCNVSVVDISES